MVLYTIQAGKLACAVGKGVPDLADPDRVRKDGSKNQIRPHRCADAKHGCQNGPSPPCSNMKRATGDTLSGSVRTSPDSSSASKSMSCPVERYGCTGPP